jgi:hypothetical protein
MASLTQIQNFDYTAHFGNTELAEQAKTVRDGFHGHVDRTAHGRVEWGRYLQSLLQECQKQFGQEGKKIFQDWIESPEFGCRAYLAYFYIEFSLWYEQFSSSTQKLILSQTSYWCDSWLRVLMREDPQQVEAFLKRAENYAGRRTSKVLESLLSKNLGKRRLIPGQNATEEDWQLVAQVYELDSEQLGELQHQAQPSCEIEREEDERIIKTDDLVKVLAEAGYDTTLIVALPKTPKPKRYTQAEVDRIFEKAEAHWQRELALKDSQLEQTRKELAIIQAQKERERQISAATREDNQRLRQQLELMKQQLEAAYQKTAAEPVADFQSSDRSGAANSDLSHLTLETELVAQADGDRYRVLLDQDNSPIPTLYNTTNKTAIESAMVGAKKSFAPGRRSLSRSLPSPVGASASSPSQKAIALSRRTKAKGFG